MVVSLGGWWVGGWVGGGWEVGGGEGRWRRWERREGEGGEEEGRGGRYRDEAQGITSLMNRQAQHVTDDCACNAQDDWNRTHKEDTLCER